MKSPSLKGRIMLGLTLSFAAGAGVLALSLYDLRDQLRRVTVKIQAQEIARDFTMQSDPASLPRTHAGGELSYTLYSPSGEVMWFSENLKSPRRLRPGPDPQGFQFFQRPIYSGRVINVAAPLADGATLVVAKRDEWERQAIGELLQAKLLQSLVLLLPVGLIALWLIYLVMRWTLKPVQEAALLMQNMADDKAQTVPTAALPTELLPLAHAVNGSLEKLAQSLANEKKLVADAAHELRTPLTVLDLRLQKARAEATMDWNAIGNDLGYLRQVTDQLLLLARQDQDAVAGQARLDAPVTHLTRVAREVIAGMHTLFEGEARSIHVELIDAVHCPGDESLIRTAISNVLENALYHGKGAVTVAMTRTESAVHLTIADEGPGVPPQRQEAMFVRFNKGVPNSRGAGLGLAISRKILRNLEGDVRFLDGPCAAVELCFKASP